MGGPYGVRIQDSPTHRARVEREIAAAAALNRARSLATVAGFAAPLPRSLYVPRVVRMCWMRKTRPMRIRPPLPRGYPKWTCGLDCRCMREAGLATACWIASL